MEDIFGSPFPRGTRTDVKLKPYPGEPLADNDRSSLAAFYNAREQAVREQIIAHQLVQVHRHKVPAAPSTPARPPPHPGAGPGYSRDLAFQRPLVRQHARKVTRDRPRSLSRATIARASTTTRTAGNSRRSSLISSASRTWAR